MCSTELCVSENTHAEMLRTISQSHLLADVETRDAFIDIVCGLRTVCDVPCFYLGTQKLCEIDLMVVQSVL
jgi:hypothetical protein